MIKYCENNEEIITLWQEAFQDSREDIEFFIDNVKNAKCLMYYENGEAASMLYLIDCNIGKYIYAACTLEKYRGKGLMTKLLESCNFKVCLIPANDGLVKYYKDRGLKSEVPIHSIKFNQISEIEEYLFEGYNLTKPVALTN